MNHLGRARRYRTMSLRHLRDRIDIAESTLVLSGGFFFFFTFFDQNSGPQYMSSEFLEFPQVYVLHLLVVSALQRYILANSFGHTGVLCTDRMTIYSEHSCHNKRCQLPPEVVGDVSSRIALRRFRRTTNISDEISVIIPRTQILSWHCML
jgi:hypothetical protein